MRFAMQMTTAFAPRPEDFDDGLFDMPVISSCPLPVADEESEPGEP
jgi:hypothetical protein